MPSRTSSPTLLITSRSELYSPQLSCVSFMKPYASTYITDYINSHNAKEKTGHCDDNLPLSPYNDKSSKKRVLFADAVGLDLVQVRYMTAGRDTPPNLDPKIFSALDISKDKPVVPTLQLDFQQPVSDYCQFRQSLEHNHVCLESVSINDNVVVGTVKVKNMAFHKTVFVRITYDGWVSSENVAAYYVNNGLFNAQGDELASPVDTFSFTHEVPVDKITQRGVEFAVCFRCNEQEFWDNNSNKNYHITVKDGTAPYSKSDFSLKKAFEETNWTEFAIWRDLESDYTPYW